jgi:hypothetical protein
MKSLITLIATLATVSAFAQPAKNMPEPKATETKTEAKAHAKEAESGKPMLLAKKKEDKKSEVTPNKSPSKADKKNETKPTATPATPATTK